MALLQSAIMLDKNYKNFSSNTKKCKAMVSMIQICVKNINVSIQLPSEIPSGMRVAICRALGWASNRITAMHILPHPDSDC